MSTSTQQMFGTPGSAPEAQPDANQMVRFAGLWQIPGKPIFRGISNHRRGKTVFVMYQEATGWQMTEEPGVRNPDGTFARTDAPASNATLLGKLHSRANAIKPDKEELVGEIVLDGQVHEVRVAEAFTKTGSNSPDAFVEIKGLPAIVRKETPSYFSTVKAATTPADTAKEPEPEPIKGKGKNKGKEVF